MRKCLRCEKNASKETMKHGFHPGCFKEEFCLDKDYDFVDLVPRNSDSTPKQKDSFETKIASSFFHGAFKKYSSRMGSERYILKVREDKYPELPHVEYISNKIAECIGLEVAEYHFIMFNNEVPTFVTKNFLDDYPNGNLVHIYHYLKEGKVDDFNCENLLKIIFNETKRPLDRKNFIEICLFDMIVGNHDRHGRNLALIEMKGRKVLSPCYDNPSYIGIEDALMLGAELCPKGKIYTSDSEEPNIINYIREFIKLGYEEIVNNFVTNIDFEKIKRKIYSSGMSDNRKNAFLKLVKSNVEKAKNEIK